MTTEKTNMDHAKAIIAELEGDWRVDNKQSNTEAGVYIVSGTLRLWVSNSYGVAGKLQISQGFLRDDQNQLVEPYIGDDEEVPEGAVLGEYRRAHPPSIDVSPTTNRGYKHVASHINRRIIPAARWYVERATARLSASANYEKGKVELAIRLQKAAPTLTKLLTKNYGGGSNNEIKYPSHLDVTLPGYSETGNLDSFHFGYGDIDTSNDTVEMKLRSLDPELAVVLLQTMEEWYGKQDKNEPTPEELAEEEAIMADMTGNA